MMPQTPIKTVSLSAIIRSYEVKWIKTQIKRELYAYIIKEEIVFYVFMIFLLIRSYDETL
jgi:hypothetical protein